MDRWLHTTMDSWNGLIAATRSEQAFRQEPWHLLFEVPLACDCAGHLEAVRADRCNLFRALSSCSILRLINSRIMSLQGSTPRIGRIKDKGSARGSVSHFLLPRRSGWLRSANASRFFK